jgi:hypothetical protein
VPACPFLVFVPVLLASLGIPFLGLAIAPITGIGRAGIWLAVTWLALGCTYAAWLTKVRPEAMRRITKVFEKRTSRSRKGKLSRSPERRPALTSVYHAAHTLQPWPGFGVMCLFVAIVYAIAWTLLDRRDA